MRHTVLRFKQAIVIPLALGLASSPAGLQFYGASESFAQTAPASDSAQRCDELAGDPRDPSQAGGGVRFSRIQVAEALPVCEGAAASGPPHYQFLYGRVLQKAERYQEAFQHYSAAATAGVPGAMHDLGVLYENRLGVPANSHEAQSWYRKAEEARQVEDAKTLATKPAGVSAIASDDATASAGGASDRDAPPDARAQTALRNAHGEATPVPGPARQAADLAKLTADANAGDRSAMVKVGLAYADEGTSHNQPRAAEWFRKAAEAGSAHRYVLLCQDAAGGR